eukprot:CAMPEP_0171974494 /NCGR_PEP_ID=MMETSP0993-20121228/232662_1 /TAXON_ID=483369 /ORGANISM="non described non described, Strain CCMP2098" /LENGTH=36 /DNA_ID= /DNA_START= /DNA_END= /DNA_ORIENTATION=
MAHTTSPPVVLRAPPPLLSLSRVSRPQQVVLAADSE